MTKLGRERFEKLIHLIKTETVPWRWNYQYTYAPTLNCGCALPFVAHLPKAPLELHPGNGLYTKDGDCATMPETETETSKVLARYFGVSQKDIIYLFHSTEFPGTEELVPMSEFTKDMWITRAEAFLEAHK